MSRTVSDLIEAFGGNVAVARVIGKEPSTVSEMKRAGKINPRYWPVIIAAARTRGPDLNWITSEALMMMHSREDSAAPASQAVAP